MVRLYVNNQNARTILPTINETDFKFFNVIFIATSGKTTYFPVQGKLQDVNTGYLIAEGSYAKIVVQAFYTDYCDLNNLGAIGENTIPFNVPGSDNERNVILDAFHSDLETKGKFEWDIGNENIFSLDTAEMTIKPRQGTCTKGNPVTVNFLVSGFQSSDTYLPGIYDVSFTFGKSGYASVKFSEILYIAPGGATSYYSYKIPKLASLTVNISYNLNSPDSVDKPLGTLSVGDKIESAILPAFTLNSYSNDFDPTEKFKGWYKDKSGKKNGISILTRFFLTRLFMRNGKQQEK